MSRSIVRSVLVGLDPDTSIRVVTADGNPRYEDEPGFDRLDLNGEVTLWPGYLGGDEQVVASVDHLVEALQTIRSRALARLATAEAHASFHADPETVQRAMAGDR